MLIFLCILLALPLLAHAQGATVSGPTPTRSCEQQLAAVRDEIATLQAVERLIDTPRARQDKRTLIQLGRQVEQDAARIKALEAEVAALKAKSPTSEEN